VKDDTTISVTANEANALHAIMKSEYSDGGGRGVWVFSIKASTTGRALGGVLSSLVKKGLIEMGGDFKANGGFDEDTYASLTELGVAFVKGKPGFKTVAPRASKIVPSAEPTIAAEPTAEPKGSVGAASVWARPQSEKLVALNLAMCPKGKLFGAKASCKCCGAIVQPVLAEAVPAAKKSRKAGAKADAAPAISDATRAKNADAKAVRAAKRAGTALASVGSGS
jgi:hypothetical protein